ncbi:unnamed protein product [Closterium sp. Naga37s-1]|nr:unnamed protein product [Closterium sp. Naga37s-1]
MARKRKGQSLNDCPKDLNDIPYIRWMNQQIANGRHPTGLSAPPALDGQGSGAQSPSAGPSRVRRQPARTAATVRPVMEQEVDDDDEEYRGDEEDEPEDLGMSDDDDDDDDGDDDDADDDAEEEAQPVAQPPKRGAARALGTDKGKGKAVDPPPRQEPRKKRSAAPVKRGLWADKESAIFAAARWFMKDELEPLKGSNPGWCQNVNALQKQWRNLMLLWQEYKRGDGGSGNGYVEKPPWWPYLELFNKDTAAAAPHAVDGGGATNVNVPAGMEVPSASQLEMSTPTFTAPPPQPTGTPKRARVHETATMQAAMLVSATIKDCHGDAMTRIEGLVREWMAQDMRLARERMTESAPPDVHRATTDFSPPPPRGESAPPPGAAQPRDDVGDVNPQRMALPPYSGSVTAVLPGIVPKRRGPLVGVFEHTGINHADEGLGNTFVKNGVVVGDPCDE